MSQQTADAFMGIFGLHRVKSVYGCQSYDINRLCRFDRQAIDHNCAGCPRTTDRSYLERMGLWVKGVAF